MLFKLKYISRKAKKMEKGKGTPRMEQKKTAPQKSYAITSPVVMKNCSDSSAVCRNILAQERIGIQSQKEWIPIGLRSQVLDRQNLRYRQVSPFIGSGTLGSGQQVYRF